MTPIKTTTKTTNTTTTTAHTALDEVDDDGNFKRTAAGFDNAITKGGTFEPDANRYHLYVALGCPWAAGTLAALKYKGLDDVIGHSIVHPVWRRTNTNTNTNNPTTNKDDDDDDNDDDDDKHVGWHFRSPGDPPVTNELGHGSFECDDALIPDTINGANTIREIYENSNDTTGKYTTPVLFDTKTNTIVNNESLEILKLFDDNTALGGLAKYPERKLFPDSAALVKEGDEWNELIYNNVNNGVYRCGFAKKQGAYEIAHTNLFDSLDTLEKHFANKHMKRSTSSTSSTSNSTSTDGNHNHFLLSNNEFTWLDIRLYMTLVRFDPVYVVHFKTSHKKIESEHYPHLLKYMRFCYQTIPAIRESTNIRHIKMHYFGSHPTLNTYGIIPVSNGPDLDLVDVGRG